MAFKKKAKEQEFLNHIKKDLGEEGNDEKEIKNTLNKLADSNIDKLSKVILKYVLKSESLLDKTINAILEKSISH